MPVTTKINNPTVRKFLGRINKEKDYRERVVAGIKVLDKEFTRPVWLKRIKVSTLNLNNASLCVCGQVFGDYTDMLFGGRDTYDLGSRWKHNHGFVEDFDAIGEEEMTEDYDLLTYVWWKELTKLKK